MDRFKIKFVSFGTHRHSLTHPIGVVYICVEYAADDQFNATHMSTATATTTTFACHLDYFAVDGPTTKTTTTTTTLVC